MKTRPMSAWLIMWEWFGEAPSDESPYVDILSARHTITYIKEYLQRLHDVRCLSLRERIPLARYHRPARPPYEATVCRSAHGAEIRCGHEPQLVARPVKNLVIETDLNTGAEKVTWTPYLVPNSN
jgi:hypothetical protein